MIELLETKDIEIESPSKKSLLKRQKNRLGSSN